MDKWLFFARIVKSRTLGGSLAAEGRIKINGKISTGANNAVRVGDILGIRHGSRLLTCRVLGLGERRGPAAQASCLYEDLTPQPSERTPSVVQRDPGSGRPEKKDRRALERLRTSIFDGDNGE